MPEFLGTFVLLLIGIISISVDELTKLPIKSSKDQLLFGFWNFPF